LRTCALALSLSASLGLLNTSALADDSGIYAGVSLGSLEAEEEQFSSSEQSLGIEAGYQFNRYLKAEVSLFDLGDHSDIGMKGNGMSLSLVASYPISNGFSAFAAFGGMMLNLDIDEARSPLTQTGKESLQDGKDTGFLTAYGLEYRVNKWSIIAKNTLADTDADLNIFSLGAHYHF